MGITKTINNNINLHSIRWQHIGKILREFDKHLPKATTTLTLGMSLYPRQRPLPGPCFPQIASSGRLSLSRCPAVPPVSARRALHTACGAPLLQTQLQLAALVCRGSSEEVPGKAPHAVKQQSRSAAARKHGGAGHHHGAQMFPGQRRPISSRMTAQALLGWHNEHPTEGSQGHTSVPFVLRPFRKVTAPATHE